MTGDTECPPEAAGGDACWPGRAEGLLVDFARLPRGVASRGLALRRSYGPARPSSPTGGGVVSFWTSCESSAAFSKMSETVSRTSDRVIA